MRLNSSQKQAVEFVTGPCLVIAGAGSGKTRVIINKITHLIHDCGYQPRHITAVTFTNKAAREMKERVIKIMGHRESSGLIISTFHALGLAIIKKEHTALKIQSQFSLFDDQDQLALIRDLTEQWLKNDKMLVNQLISTISNWKNSLVNPTRAMALSHSERDKLFAYCYNLYHNHIRACNVLDFDDLILLPTLLLRQNKKVRERWQSYIRYLLVDEYQDTNTSQYELVKLLVGNRKCFTVVGDDDQSIYSWRGAQPQNIALLKQNFSALQVIKLEQNYRSSERILKAANLLIANNAHVFEKKLFSRMGCGEMLKVIIASNAEHEAERGVGELIAHRFKNKTQYSDYAILYRGNHQSRLFETILTQNRIPYKISGGTSFFERPEIKDLLSYLRILTNPDDDMAFLRIVNTPKREIGQVTLQKLSKWANKRKKSLFRASFDLGLNYSLSSHKLESLQRFTNWLSGVAELTALEPVTAVHNLIQGMNYENWLSESSPNPQSAKMRIKNLNTLVSWMTEMLMGNDFNKPLTLSQVVARFTLRDMIDRDTNKEQRDQVQLMTLHASKGLEFPYVFLVGMEEGLLPHQISIDANNIDEERRLAYVGMTRAKKMLTFTLCRERCKFGRIVRPEPSRFLFELPQDDLTWDGEPRLITPKDLMQKGKNYLAKIRTQLASVK